MFILKDGILSSDIFDRFENVVNGFSTRLCGFSTLPRTSGMNFSYGAGDDRETVLKNAELFAESVSSGKLSLRDCVSAEQVHSSSPRLIGKENRGEGYGLPYGIPADGFVTREKGILPIIRTADCVPVLLCGRDIKDEAVICALHAGWKGIVRDIIKNGITLMEMQGALKDTIVSAVGPHICDSHFEVKNDFIEIVEKYKGKGYIERFLKKRDGRMFASLREMCIHELNCAGISSGHIDVYEGCTYESDMFYSNRRDGSVRGTMGSAIGIL